MPADIHLLCICVLLHSLVAANTRTYIGNIEIALKSLLDGQIFKVHLQRSLTEVHTIDFTKVLRSFKDIYTGLDLYYNISK